MDCVDDQQPSFKHHCRVCKKGFMCGRALGGHMRAHGIGDENAYLDDAEDDHMNNWEDKLGGPTNKRKYQLRTNPNRLKSCRNCEHCGKEFSSWKSFLEHGKCNFDDASESLVSSHESDEEEYNEKCTTGWLKRKRTVRAKVSSNYSTTEEEEDLLLAACLLQLANPVANPPIVEPEELCASASREEERRSPVFFGMSRTTFARPKVLPNPTPKGLFECKACKKVFTSHQALGGHRATHKKVKGCYAAKLDQHVDDHSFGLDDEGVTHEEFFPSKPAPSFQFIHGTSLSGAVKRKTKVHECSICHRVFSSGQALGGHKRCHWIVNNAPEPAPVSRFQFLGNIDKSIHQSDADKPRTEKSEPLDLNVPAWVHISGVRRDPHNPLSFDVSTDPHVDLWTCNEAETVTKLAIPSSNI